MIDRTAFAFPLSLAVLLWIAPATRADNAPQSAGAPFKSVAELQEFHDRAKLRDLNEYLHKNPKAGDLDAAYLALFNLAIDNEWYAETETAAKQYLAEHPKGSSRALALIVTTMAHAGAGRFGEALTNFKDLMGGLNKADQEQFASDFADSLAALATAAGDFAVARQVYETLLDRFGESPELRQKVRDDLARLDLVGKPAPAIVVNDIDGQTFRLAQLKGKVVLVDFWATWCAPCIAELPNVQAAYAKYHDRGFEVVSVSLDEKADAVTDFVKARKIPWRQIHNATSGGDMVDTFEVNNLPASFLIGPDGVITRLELRGPTLDQVLSKLLPPPKS